MILSLFLAFLSPVSGFASPVDCFIAASKKIPLHNEELSSPTAPIASVEMADEKDAIEPLETAQIIKLCSGTHSDLHMTLSPVECLRSAYRKNNGLGLDLTHAIQLCASAKSSNAPIDCYRRFKSEQVKAATAGARSKLVNLKEGEILQLCSGKDSL